MSAPTEENKKPAGIESFLIVAYRALRASNSGLKLGRCFKSSLNLHPLAKHCDGVSYTLYDRTDENFICYSRTEGSEFVAHPNSIKIITCRPGLNKFIHDLQFLFEGQVEYEEVHESEQKFGFLMSKCTTTETDALFNPSLGESQSARESVRISKNLTQIQIGEQTFMLPKLFSLELLNKSCIFESEVSFMQRILYYCTETNNGKTGQQWRAAEEKGLSCTFMFDRLLNIEVQLSALVLSYIPAARCAQGNFWIDLQEASFYAKLLLGFYREVKLSLIDSLISSAPQGSFTSKTPITEGNRGGQKVTNREDSQPVNSILHKSESLPSDVKKLFDMDSSYITEVCKTENLKNLLSNRVFWSDLKNNFTNSVSESKHLLSNSDETVNRYETALHEYRRLLSIHIHRSKLPSETRLQVLSNLTMSYVDDLIQKHNEEIISFRVFPDRCVKLPKNVLKYWEGTSGHNFIMRKRASILQNSKTGSVTLLQYPMQVITRFIPWSNDSFILCRSSQSSKQVFIQLHYFDPQPKQSKELGFSGNLLQVELSKTTLFCLAQSKTVDAADSGFLFVTELSQTPSSDFFTKPKSYNLRQPFSWSDLYDSQSWAQFPPNRHGYLQDTNKDQPPVTDLYRKEQYLYILWHRVTNPKNIQLWRLDVTQTEPPICAEVQPPNTTEMPALRWMRNTRIPTVCGVNSKGSYMLIQLNKQGKGVPTKAVWRQAGGRLRVALTKGLKLSPTCELVGISSHTATRIKLRL